MSTEGAPGAGPVSRVVRAAAAAGTRPAGAGLLLVGIIALGSNLRAAVASLPPIFPELHDTLHVSSVGLSVLASIPVLCFGVFSGFAGPLSRRFGEERVLGAAVALLAAGLLLRGTSLAALLFGGTVLAGGAIALLNVLLPSLVKRRAPERAGRMIGYYLVSMGVGAILAALIAVPIFTAAGGGRTGARLGLAIWAVPAVLATVLWLPQLRHRAAARPAAGSPQVAGPGVLAMRKSALAWQVTAFMGLQSLSYYASLSWFPTLFRNEGISAVHAGELLALMGLGNAMTGLLVPIVAHRSANQRLLVICAAVATAVGLAGCAFGPIGTTPVFAIFLGFGQGATLALGIFFAVARAADPATSASLSAFSQGAGYLIAATGPLLIGLLHAATGGWAIPVWTLLGVAVLQLISGLLAGRALTVRLPGQDSGAAGNMH